jgi:transposase InsO family protein
MSARYKVAWLCEALLVSRSGYYDWKKRRSKPGPRAIENTRLRAQIRQQFTRSRQTYGSPRIAHALGCPGRRNRIARLDQVWATDATCVLTGQGWLYLVVVLDLFSRRVVGWAMSQLLDAPLAIAALRMALSQRRPTKSLIVHSDRGSQFASATYRQLLTQHDLSASMARKGNCYDNAFIESFFSSLKYELVYHHRFLTLSEARTAIFNYIETFYNRTRLHSSLDYQSPTNFESQLNPNYP